MHTTCDLAEQMKGLDLCSIAPPSDPVLLDNLSTRAHSVSELVVAYSLDVRQTVIW